MSIASDINTSVFGYKPKRGSKWFVPKASNKNTVSLFHNVHIEADLAHIQDDILRFPQYCTLNSYNKQFLPQKHVELMEICSNFKIYEILNYLDLCEDADFSTFLNQKYGASDGYSKYNASQKNNSKWNLIGSSEMIFDLILLQCNNAEELKTIKEVVLYNLREKGLCIIRYNARIIGPNESKVLHEMMKWISQLQVYKPRLSHPFQVVKYIVIKRGKNTELVSTIENFRRYIYEQNNLMMHYEMHQMKKLRRSIDYGCFVDKPYDLHLNQLQKQFHKRLFETNPDQVLMHDDAPYNPTSYLPSSPTYTPSSPSYTPSSPPYTPSSPPYTPSSPPYTPSSPSYTPSSPSYTPSSPSYTPSSPW
jgi:hypothetical protein